MYTTGDTAYSSTCPSSAVPDTSPPYTAGDTSHSSTCPSSAEPAIPPQTPVPTRLTNEEIIIPPPEGNGIFLNNEDSTGDNMLFLTFQKSALEGRSPHKPLEKSLIKSILTYRCPLGLLKILAMKYKIDPGNLYCEFRNRRFIVYLKNVWSKKENEAVVFLGETFTGCFYKKRKKIVEDCMRLDHLVEEDLNLVLECAKACEDFRKNDRDRASTRYETVLQRGKDAGSGNPFRLCLYATATATPTQRKKVILKTSPVDTKLRAVHELRKNGTENWMMDEHMRRREEEKSMDLDNIFVSFLVCPITVPDAGEESKRGIESKS
ncbi:hypothetical protein P280DRAFT_534311 [Massarina eburnea CBS 473.64]|uniref:Uncharacterized protein n=1 Tax=Massarina eburnea CBS 473.64 TaxID=1395130 RepID=A0A6A6RPS8_9PLEO|nr:hypothetical protein P280DRAFT_534311 [Massarina eburnea CBS 473.64]